MNKLSKEGLILNTPNKVHKVFNLSTRELTETMEIRTMCECYSIEKAIINIKKEIFGKIYDDALKLKELTNKKIICQRFYSMDLEFHEKIIEGTNNAKLITIYKQIYFIIKTVIYRIDNKEKDIEDFIIEHIDILSSIINKDASKAKNLLKKHLEHSTKYYLENFINPHI